MTRKFSNPVLDTYFSGVKYFLLFVFFVGCTCVLANETDGRKLYGGNLIDGELKTHNLPDSELPYSIWEPPSYSPGQSMPLIIFLHGGRGSRKQFQMFLPLITAMMKADKLPEAIWSSPSADRSFYMDYKDGSALWETVLIDEYIPMLMDKYAVTDANNIVLVGVSMGGMGGLRLAFKYPKKFGAVAVLEPAIEAALSWNKVTDSDTFYREDIYVEIFGDPVDPEYWAKNNPATIAINDPRALDTLSIYFEVGDADPLRLYRGGEFLHRVLFDNAVKHEFRLVHNADHFGKEFLKLRAENLLGFVNRHFNPVEESLTTRMMVKGLELYIGEHAFSDDVPLPPHIQHEK